MWPKRFFLWKKLLSVVKLILWQNFFLWQKLFPSSLTEICFSDGNSDINLFLWWKFSILKDFFFSGRIFCLTYNCFCDINFFSVTEISFCHNFFFVTVTCFCDQICSVKKNLVWTFYMLFLGKSFGEKLDFSYYIYILDTHFVEQCYWGTSLKKAAVLVVEPSSWAPPPFLPSMFAVEREIKACFMAWGSKRATDRARVVKASRWEPHQCWSKNSDNPEYWEPGIWKTCWDGLWRFSRKGDKIRHSKEY